MKTNKITYALTGLILALPVQATDLSEVYEMALRQDAEFRAATAQYHANLQQKPLARGALLPQLIGGYSDSDSTTEIVEISGQGAFPLAASSGDTTVTGYTISLQQPLYDHSLWKRLQQADAQVAQASADYAAVKQQFILRVAETYFNVLAAIDNLAFAEAESRAVGQQLEQAKQRFEVGLIAITDVKESQAQYDQAIAAEIEARNNLDRANESLWTLTNTDIQQLAALGETLPLNPPEPTDKQQWVERALSDNLTLKSAKYARIAADKQVSIARSLIYPSLNLKASKNFSENDFSSALNPNFDNLREIDDTSVAIELTVPLFIGGARSGIKQAIYQRDAARELLELTRRQTIQRTRDSYQNTLADISRVKALKQALISSQAAYEATEAGFEVGTRNSVEVLLSLRNTFRAERDYAQTRYNYLLNSLRLKEAAGSLQAQDLHAINNWLK